MSSTPVLMLVFNRPDTTKEVFEAVRVRKPARLYVASDGPRPDRLDDATKCAAVREIISSIDWPCELKTLYREDNLGCRDAVSSAISWFFENEPEGIILEDDTLPNQDFFDFCDLLLDVHRENPRVALVSGINFQFGIPRGDASYYYSIYTHFWGWASWRRTWEQYDVDMKKLPELLASDKLQRLCSGKEEAEYWADIFQAVDRQEINCWGYQLQFQTFLYETFTALPNKNMISNIGFASDATHTKSESFLANIPRERFQCTRHPEQVVPHRAADAYSFRYIFQEGFSSESFLLVDILKHYQNSDFAKGLMLVKSASNIYQNKEALRMLDAIGAAKLGFHQKFEAEYGADPDHALRVLCDQVFRPGR